MGQAFQLDRHSLADRRLFADRAAIRAGVPTLAVIAEGRYYLARPVRSQVRTEGTLSLKRPTIGTDATFAIPINSGARHRPPRRRRPEP